MMVHTTATCSRTGLASRALAALGTYLARLPDCPTEMNTDPCYREYVLRRDGSGVSVGSDCYPTSGSWTCPYSGRRHTVPSSVDIDHMVPLKNAWVVSSPSSLFNRHIKTDVRILVWCQHVVYFTPSAVRQRHQRSTAVGYRRKHQFCQRRQEPRSVEASSDWHLVQLCQVLDPGQELLRPSCDLC
jgi:hypothetical protein